MKAVLFFLALLPGLAHAADPQAASRLIGEIEGVYKKRFTNAVIAGPGKPDETYVAEDVVEIVRYDDTHIYLRAHLEFYNGHSCGIYGIAGYENGRFVYREPRAKAEPFPPCELSLSAAGDELVMTDRATPDARSSCKSYCGARGSLGDYRIARKAQRPIRYLERLKQSRQYKEAEQELAAPKK